MNIICYFIIMVEHKCSKCGKIFNRKSSLDNHLNRINPCAKKNKPDRQYKCKHCSKAFAKKYNLDRHIKNIHKITSNVNNNIKNSKNSITHSKNAVIGDINNNFTINNNNQFFLLPFGTYCLDKDLSIEDRVKIFSSKSGAIETIILKTHLNPELPQYHNCGITDMHVSYGIIYDGNNWVCKPISDIMYNLITNGQKESIELYEQIKNFIQDDVRKVIKDDLHDDKFMLYPHYDHDNKKSQKNLVKYLKPKFYNQRELVKNSIKNSGKKVIGTEKNDFDTCNILKEGITYQDIEEHIRKYKQNKEKIMLKKELALHILDQLDNIIDFKYDELCDKIDKIYDVKIMNIITQLLIQSLCGQIDINKLIIDNKIKEIMKINKIFCP